MRCARLDRDATWIECCEVIVATKRTRDLATCRACGRGMALAASTPMSMQRAAAPATPTREARKPDSTPKISRPEWVSHAPARPRRSGQGHIPPAPPGPFEIEALTWGGRRHSAPRQASKAEGRQAASPALAPAPARAVAQDLAAVARAMGVESREYAQDLCAVTFTPLPPLLAALIEVLAYAIPRYARQPDLGLKFTAMLIHDRAGLDCTWRDLETLCLEQGLTLNRRKGSAFVALDDTARELAGRMG